MNDKVGIFREDCRRGLPTAISGFALIELLIAVMVVAVLAAIVVPSLNTVRQLNSKASVLAGADAALTRMPWQELVYQAPRRMEIGSTGLVEVALGGNQTVAELSQLLQHEGNVIGQRVQVSARMEAHLTGSGFQIVATTPEIQLISTRQPTIWQWQVKANDLGGQTLYLSLNALLTINDKDATKSVRTFQREIVVQVTSMAGFWGFVERYWIYLAAIAGVVASLLAYIWKRRSD